MLPKIAGENSMGNMAGRPTLNAIIKQAMAESAQRANVTDEALRQSTKEASEKCAKCHKEMEKCACAKEASAGGNDEQVEKLAGALEFLAEELTKEGSGLAGQWHLSEHLQGPPPGVSQATASTPLPDHKGQGVKVTPMHPGEEKGLSTEHGATKMETNLHHPVAGKMMETNYGKKTAAEIVRAKLAGVKEGSDAEKKETQGMAEAKQGLEKAEKAHESEPENKGKEANDKGTAAPSTLVDYMLSRTKQAEDALNPAKISAGAAVPPQTSAAGQPGGAPAGGAPKGPTGLVASADSARHYTKGQAYANRKEDLKKYFQEPALSAEHDKVLQVAFQHTGQAGTKFASAEGAEGTTSAPSESMRTAAGRMLLSKLAQAVEADRQQQPAGGAAQ
jgi:hypothetical protein